MRIKWTQVEADRQVLCDWLIANHLNPYDIPEKAEIAIARGYITTPVYLRDPNHRHILVGDDAAQGTLRVRVTVPWSGLNE